MPNAVKTLETELNSLRMYRDMSEDWQSSIAYHLLQICRGLLKDPSINWVRHEGMKNSCALCTVGVCIALLESYKSN